MAGSEREREQEREPSPPDRAAAQAPASARRVEPSRRDLRAAGGYEAQRDLLRPFPPAGPRTAGSGGNGGGPSANAATSSEPPRRESVRTLQARVMREPHFVNASVATLRRGAEVVVVGRQGSWLRVRLREGQEGWLHDHHVRDPRPMLRSGNTGSQNVRTDVPDDSDMAGRG